MSYQDEETLLKRAENLADACLRAWVNKNQVEQILAHLQSRRDVSATLTLLDELSRSCFARRFSQTQKQYDGLKTHVGNALRGQRDWRQMARLLGWTCRFMEAKRR